MNELVAAVIGAVIGALVVFLAELWRQVLDGVSAARIIYVEATNNSVICEDAAKGVVYRPLSDNVWQEHATKVVPLLTDEATQSIATVYLGIPMTQALISTIHESAEPDTRDLEIVARDFHKAELWMQRIFRKSRLKLLAELTSGRVTGPSSDQIDRFLKSKYGT